MMQRSVLLAFCFAFLACWCVSAQDGTRIVITKGARTSNPTVIFKGVEGNEKLSADIRSALLLCGWFDVVKGGSADYVISGTGTDRSVSLQVSNSAGAEAASVAAAGRNAEDTAHAAVDAVLQKLFNIPGICRSQIIFTAETGNGRKEIAICGFDGKNVQLLTKNHALSMDPLWSPDGRSIIYSLIRNSTTNLVQYDTVTKFSRLVSRYKGLNAGGAISPDSKYIALVLNRDNRVDLYIRELEGKQLIRLTNDNAVEASPCWSPDGKTVCFVSDATNRPVLYTVKPFEDAKVRRMSGLSGSERVTPCWGTDNKLTYSARVGRNYVVAVADMKSGTPEKITVGETEALIPGEGPSWAPDGRHAAVEHNGKIFIVDTWLGRKRQLFSGSTKTGQPDWSPLMK